MRICDVVRCSIVVETEEQLAAVLKALLDGQMNGEGVKVTVARLKNRFAEPMFTGIMDCLLNVLVEVEGQGGHVCEIQVRPPRALLYFARAQGSHSGSALASFFLGLAQHHPPLCAALPTVTQPTTSLRSSISQASSR